MPAIGVADAVVIPERAPAVEALHALHEVDIEVDAALRHRVAEAAPIAGEGRSGPQITAVILDLRQLCPRHTAHPYADHTHICPQLLHGSSSVGSSPVSMRSNAPQCCPHCQSAHPNNARHGGASVAR